MLSGTPLAICATFVVDIAATAASPATGQSPTGWDHPKRKMEIERHTLALSTETLDRKTRSVTRLKAQGVPTPRKTTTSAICWALRGSLRPALVNRLRR